MTPAQMQAELRHVAGQLNKVVDDVIASRCGDETFALESWQDALLKCRSARLRIEDLADRVGESLEAS